MSQWPAPIVRLFLGDTTFEVVLKAADDASSVKMRGQICEANFYAGEQALGRGATDEAVRLLHLAVDACPTRHLEWSTANAELQVQLRTGDGGPAWKALIEEEYGDGIMSAIDFDIVMERLPNPKGDRVKITMSGKFLPYKYYGASGNVPEYGSKEG